MNKNNKYPLSQSSPFGGIKGGFTLGDLGVSSDKESGGGITL